MDHAIFNGSKQQIMTAIQVIAKIEFRAAPYSMIFKNNQSKSKNIINLNQKCSEYSKKNPGSYIIPGPYHLEALANLVIHDKLINYIVID